MTETVSNVGNARVEGLLVGPKNGSVAVKRKPGDGFCESENCSECSMSAECGGTCRGKAHLEQYSAAVGGMKTVQLYIESYSTSQIDVEYVNTIGWGLGWLMPSSSPRCMEMELGGELLHAVAAAAEQINDDIVLLEACVDSPQFDSGIEDAKECQQALMRIDALFRQELASVCE